MRISGQKLQSTFVGKLGTHWGCQMMLCIRSRKSVMAKDRAKSQSRQQSWEDLPLSVQVTPQPIQLSTIFQPQYNVSIIIDYQGRTESEYSLYLSYDCEGDQDRTHVRQSSYTCAAPATTTTTTTTTAVVNSAVSFVEVSTDCPHDPGSSCYLQSKTGMDWYQAEKVEGYKHWNNRDLHKCIYLNLSSFV